MYITGNTGQSYLADVASGQFYCLVTNSTDNYLLGTIHCFLTCKYLSHQPATNTQQLVKPQEIQTYTRWCFIVTAGSSSVSTQSNITKIQMTNMTLHKPPAMPNLSEDITHCPANLTLASFESLELLTNDIWIDVNKLTIHYWICYWTILKLITHEKDLLFLVIIVYLYECKKVVFVHLTKMFCTFFNSIWGFY